MTCYLARHGDHHHHRPCRPERALVRLEFMVRFGQAPRLADGIWVRTWRGGLLAGQPKVPPALAGMLARGLVTLGPDRIGVRAHFTPDGYAALRRLAQDRRALDPAQYGHLLRELADMDADPAAPAQPLSQTDPGCSEPPSSHQCVYYAPVPVIWTLLHGSAA